MGVRVFSTPLWGLSRRTRRPTRRGVRVRTLRPRLALALDYLSLSNRLYYLGLGAVDNVIPVSASIVAVVVGHIALAQAGRFAPGRGRRGLAIAALVLGYLSLVVFLAFIGVLLYSFFTTG